MLFCKGNDAVVYGALLGGCTHYFGYPITPASEISHAAAVYFPKAGRVFLQSECELSAINSVYGAAAAGARAMTASSGPGISLMAEGLSYMAGANLPGVVVDIQRAGPGLGNIWPEQGDYNTAVKGGGHGNYRNVVLAPYSVQELCDLTCRAFEIADRYRVVVFVLADACIGQMMEPLRMPSAAVRGARKDWAVYGDAASKHNVVTSIFMDIETQSRNNIHLQEKYAVISRELVEYEEVETGDAETLYVAFGISARICLSALKHMRANGVRIGMFRPKTLYPFPGARMLELARKVRRIIVVELNNGQMAEDVELHTRSTVPVLRYNWMGGKVPSAEELIERTEQDV